MIRHISWFFIVLFSLIPEGYPGSRPILGAQESLPTGRLTVRLNTRVIQIENFDQVREIWARESEKITLSGQAVSIKLTGRNIVIFTRITPYYRDSNTILIIAQGEVFYSFQEEINYSTTLKTLSVSPGESVLFFPLGRETPGGSSSGDAGGSASPSSSPAAEPDYYIEVEILILPEAG
ncbi:MAG: hypothetical protein LBQ61_04965 [Spirochaetales bacterium]|nr:hypothetical protein [Spirochaetales bacterium]